MPPTPVLITTLVRRTSTATVVARASSHRGEVRYSPPPIRRKVIGGEVRAPVREVLPQRDVQTRSEPGSGPSRIANDLTSSESASCATSRSERASPTAVWPLFLVSAASD